MSKHYPWWGYVRYMVRQYSVWSNMLRAEMSNAELNGWCAVKRTVDSTERMEDGADRLKIIRMVHWDRTHTLEGAALSIPCSRRTAAYWQREFFEEVARNRGLLD